MQRDDIAARLLLALDRRDDLVLASLLNPDARLVIDTGDHSGRELHGRARVADALRELPAQHPDAALMTARVNGGQGLALRQRDEGVIGVLAIDLDPSGSIAELWLTTAADKLAHWNHR